MRVWVIWPEAAKTSLAHVITAGGGTIAYTDDVLDRAEADWSTRAVDVVVVNSLTPGSQDFAKWIIARHFDRPDLRIIVAFPPLTRNPQGKVWAQQLLSAAVVDWVMDGPQFAQDLQARLTTPWTWAQAVQMLGGPDALTPAPVSSSPASGRRTAEDTEYAVDPPHRREVVVVSPAKPIIIAVVGIAAGVGTSCTAVGLAEYLAALGQPTVLTEPDALRTSTFTDWQPPLRADRAPPEKSWHQLPPLKIWSYVVLDCHVNGRDIPAQADLVVVVGPGAPHRWHRWTHWDQVQSQRLGDTRERFARRVFVMAPHPGIDRPPVSLREGGLLRDAPFFIGPDVFVGGKSDAVWGEILTPVLPALGGSVPITQQWAARFPKIWRKENKKK